MRSSCAILPMPGERAACSGCCGRGSPGPVLTARVSASGDTSWIGKKPLIAYAGIANPRRFYRLLEALGGASPTPPRFPDHHWFKGADAKRLLDAAQRNGAQLVTTEKDYARLGGEEALAGLAAQTRVLSIEMQIDERELVRLNSLIETAFERRVATAPPAAGLGPLRAGAEACRASPGSAASRRPAKNTPPEARRSNSANRQHDRLAGHGTAHEVAGGENLKLPVKELDLRLTAEAKEPIDPVHTYL